MAKYEKLTLKTFKDKLKDGGYVSATGARRAVGKCQDWSEALKSKARNAIDAWFGDGGSATKKKKTKKAKKKVKLGRKFKKKKAKKKAAKKSPNVAARMRENQSIAKKASKKKANSSSLARQHASNKAAAKKRKGKRKSSDDIFENNPLAAIHIVGEVVGKAEDAIKAMRLAKETSPALDITEGVQAAQNALTASMKHMNQQVQETMGVTSEDKAANGASEETKAANFSKAAPPPPPPPSSPTASTPDQA